MDTALMHQLLKQKMIQLERYLLRLGANKSDAEDIVQETIYKGFVYIDSIHPDHFTAWLYKVALNRYYDLCRKNKRMVLPIDTIEVEDTEVPEELFLQREKREEIERVLNALSPMYKQLLIMKYEMDLSYQEISHLLDMKPDMVKTYLFRARKHFQQKWRYTYGQ